MFSHHWQLASSAPRVLVFLGHTQVLKCYSNQCHCGQFINQNNQIMTCVCKPARLGSVSTAYLFIHSTVKLSVFPGSI